MRNLHDVWGALLRTTVEASKSRRCSSLATAYVAKMLIDQRLADLRQEAEQERLAHLVRREQPQRRRWWNG